MTKNVFHPFYNPTIISVCTGMFGLERALQRTIGPIRPIAYLEIETFIIENLLSLMEQGLLHPAPVWADATTFPAEPFYNKVHGVIGGYPCQGESLAGNMAGQEDHRFIWWSIKRIIKAVNPIWCWFENVENHLNVSYPIIQESLRELGYRVEETICSAEEAGAPHGRKRIFILAVKLGNAQSDHWRNGTIQSGGRQIEVGKSGIQLGNPEYHGLYGQSEQRGNGTGSTNTQEGQNTSEQSTGTDRSGNEPGLCSELANSNGADSGRRSGNISGKANKTEGTSRQQNGQRMRHELGHGHSSGMANTTGERLQERGSIGSHPNQEFEAPERGSALPYPSSHRSDQIPFEPNEPGRAEFECNGHPGRTDRWPAPPGPYQHEWEAPRAEGNAHRLPPSLRTMWRKGRKNFAQMLGEKVWQETDHYLQAATQSSLGSTINGYNFREDLLRMYGNGVVEQQAEIALRILLQKHGIPVPSQQHK